MHWLLTNCAAPVMAPFGTAEKRPPLGIGFLAGALRQAGHQVSFIDNYLTPSGFLERDYLHERGIDAIGISASTICAWDLRRMLGRIKTLRDCGIWKGLVVVGGPHTTSVPTDVPAWVDHVVQGEGERAIVAIADGTATERLVRVPRLSNLDDLAPPAWDLFANLPYDWTASWLRVAPVFTMNTSRGCPFKCSFCSTPDIWGRKYRMLSAAWILEQVRHLQRAYGARGIYFREDNFSVSRRRVREFCEGVLRDGLKLQWVCETRVDTLTRELLENMYAAGCRGLYVGVESGSQRLLDFMDKGIDLEQVEAVFRWCYEIGIRTYASFVVGVPTETPEERAATLALPERIRATTYCFNVFVGIPTSRLYHYVRRNLLYDYIDDREIVYLHGHDQLVDEFYDGNPARKIPTPQRLARAQRGEIDPNTCSPTHDAERWVSTVRELLLRRPDARRVVVYGLGTNGQRLLHEIEDRGCLAGRELAVADDDDDPLTFELQRWPRVDPRRWNAWPSGTVAVVTPNECASMTARLEAAGGRAGVDFVEIVRESMPVVASVSTGREPDTAAVAGSGLAR